MKNKNEYIIKSTEQIELNFWAIRNSKGEFYGNSGFSKDMSRAKVYASPGPAKSLITKMMGRTWSPLIEAPDLVHITMGTCNFIDQTERTNVSVKQAKISRLEKCIKTYEYYVSKYKDQSREYYANQLAIFKQQLKELL